MNSMLDIRNTYNISQVSVPETSIFSTPLPSPLHTPLPSPLHTPLPTPLPIMKTTNDFKDIFKKNKKFNSFNATRMLKELEWCEEDDDSCVSLEYGYYDSCGRPYLDTYIRPPSLLTSWETIHKDEPEPVIPCESDPMLTCLRNPTDECPLSFVLANNTWNKAIKAYKTKLAKDKYDEEMAKFNEYTEKERIKSEELRLKAIMASLPRFPKATLERMEREKAEAERIASIPTASSKYYSTKSNSTYGSSVFGHRRNGGKKKAETRMIALPGQLSQQQLNWNKDEKYKKMIEESAAAAALSRKIKREHRKEKELKEQEEREEKRREIESRIVVPKVSSFGKVNDVEETEWQEFKRKERESFVELQKMSLVKVVEVKKPLKSFEEIIEDTKRNNKCLSVVPDNNQEKWIKKESKVKKLEKSITDALYGIVPVSSSTNMVKYTGPIHFTRLCSSVFDKSKCRHGSKCKFAHTPEQLSPTCCGFGLKCRNVIKQGEIWVNGKGRKCMFAHPGEETDKVAFCRRLGMEIKESKKELPCVVYTPNIKPLGSIDIIKRDPKNPWGKKQSDVAVFEVNDENLESVVEQIVSGKIRDVVIKVV